MGGQSSVSCRYHCMCGHQKELRETWPLSEKRKVEMPPAIKCSQCGNQMLMSLRDVNMQGKLAEIYENQ